MADNISNISDNSVPETKLSDFITLKFFGKQKSQP